MGFRRFKKRTGGLCLMNSPHNAELTDQLNFVVFKSVDDVVYRLSDVSDYGPKLVN